MHKKGDIMKKLLITLLLGIVLVSVYAGQTAVSSGNYAEPAAFTPSNIKVVEFNTAGTTYDTLIDSGSINVYGPYNLSASKTGASGKIAQGFQLWGDQACFSSGDSVQFDYQVINGTLITDTIASGWTEVDSILGANGKKGTYTHLDSLAGNNILFRLISVDSDTVTIDAPIKVYFRFADPIR